MTAVVIGVGGIGSQIAQRAHGFGMKVIGVDPKDLPPNINVTRMVYPSQLDTVLPLADVVFVSAPLTPESRHMMGPSQFDLLKKGSFFVAVSRGGLYDTPALVKALDSNRLAGAGLDVTDPEPLPKGRIHCGNSRTSRSRPMSPAIRPDRTPGESRSSRKTSATSSATSL